MDAFLANSEVATLFFVNFALFKPKTDAGLAFFIKKCYNTQLPIICAAQWAILPKFVFNQERRLTMSDDMLGRTVELLVKLAKTSSEALGVICDLLGKLLSGEGGEYLSQLKKFLRKEQCWVAGEIKKILKFVGNVTIPATTKNFVAREKFVVNTSDEAEVKISYLGNNFKEWLLNKFEEPQAGIKLRYYRLLEASVDDPIIAELGGQDQAETTLTAMFSLMKKQGHGQKGKLLTDGKANIFYIWGYAVSVGWDGGGWGVGANSVEGPSRWGAGGRVFSRNSPSAT